PGVISDLRGSMPPTEITIAWNPPAIPNGIITVYEIRYRESTSTGPYNITNTTNTYYSIVGLIPNTSYTIEVRAYTSTGPGEWTDKEYTTIEIPVIETFFITKLNSTAVKAEWSFVSGASHYTVYYESTSSSSRKKRQVETGMRVFPGGTSEGLIGGLDPNLNYLFFISTSFTVLEQVTQRPEEVTHNIASQNKDKNRSKQFLPPDNYRVPLKGEHPDYINAVFINGYKEKKAFIIAESPMFNTARNFWKMIDDRNVTAIVMLCHENENNQEVCYQYWPSTPSGMILGEYNIKLLSEETHNGYIERKFEVKQTNTGATQSVTQYQITNWDSTGKLTNPQTILLVIEEMYRTQRKRGNTSIVVHCSDTVSRSAMFCAAATTINKCKTEGVIDVFQVLKSQRIQKPGSVQTVHKYIFVLTSL
uniref:protein-tyrosine-phosphatase n=1 Tax=Amphimedon queenslandica TaxID=400682 RepID=A0A1X7TQB8_AMPQE